MSKYSYGLERISIHHPGNNQVHIGKFCSIAENCNIILKANHRTDWITTYPFGSMYCDVFNTFNGKDNVKSNGDVVIGNDVWIGTNVTIMSGVTIGDGAVIAYNSHVVKDVEPYSITGGNPAKFIKYRFEKEAIEKLLKIRWWDWEEEKINQHLELLCSPNIYEFINKCENEN
mgnify:CR=1 FL=1